MRLAEIAFLLLLSMSIGGLCLYGWLVAGYDRTMILPPASITCVVVLLAALRGWLTLTCRAGGARAGLLQGYWQELRSSSAGLLWCLALLPLLLVLGYPLGLATAAAAYARFHGAGWAATALAGGFSLAACWGLAGQLLGVPVPLLPGWMG